MRRKGENLRSLIFYLCLVVTGFWFTGCSTMQQGMGRPRINIANVTMREAKLFEQVFELELRIQNPNDMPLAINGLAFELKFNDRPFATGVSNESLVIDRLSSAVIRVEALTTLWGFIKQVAEYQRTKAPRVAYRLRGNLYVGSPSVRLPFDDSGEIGIPVDPTIRP
jgi:LEA14-like dessication related protein